jgi:hypothetical protein
MDDHRFDALTTRLASGLSRRRSLGLLAGLGMGAGVLGDEAAGKRKKKKKKKPCPPCVGRKKGKCKKRLVDGTACTGGTCRGGQCLRCADPARPNFCASTDSCLPACRNNEVFSPQTCSCACAPRTCCNCTGDAASFCSETQPTGDACFAACMAANPGVGFLYSFIGGPEASAQCQATAPGGCLLYCGA